MQTCGPSTGKMRTKICGCVGEMRTVILQTKWSVVIILNKKPSWTLGVADRTAPSHTSTIARYVFERSTWSVDKRSSYLRELVWQPSWQLDNCPDRLNCASVYAVNCELCTASAQRPVPTAGHGHAHALCSRDPLHSSQILNNISDVGYQTT